MPDTTPRDVDRTIRRQMRRVRWRRNLYELQRGVYLLIATATTAGAILVLLALRTETVTFAFAVWGLALAAVLLAATIAVTTRRRWLRAAGTPLWIDRQARLGGRLATIVELRGRAPVPALLPLLVEENARRLDAWAPEVVLPETFPSEALGAALVGACALLLAVAVAPRLEPVVRASAPSPGGPPGRLARLDGLRPTGGNTPPNVTLEDEGEERRSAFTRLPAALQDRFRRRLWGKTWEMERRATARGEDTRPSSATEGGEDLERSWQIARPRAGRPGSDAADAKKTATGDTSTAAGDRPMPPDRTEGDHSGPGQPAAGAGAGTDPNLLGAATAAADAGTRFELPIAARVRAAAGGPGPPSGDAPPRAPDARPSLAATQRRDAPVLKMDVPVAYEEIVRQVFTHAEAGAP